MVDLSHSIFMQTLHHKPVSRTPIWIMRQAGRYLPEYRATRARAGDFLSLCKNTELACEVALQPLRRFPLDAAILFSDILTVPDAMGLGLYFAEGEGPCFQRPLHSTQAIDALNLPEREALSYVMDAVRLIRQEMPADLPLIGFSGSPWTLGCYMVEGRSSRDFSRMFHLLKTAPAAAHLLLEKLASAVSYYLNEQIRAGADVLMIFDTWGGLLTETDYLHYSLAYMKIIISKLKQQYPEVPIILFTKGGAQWLNEMAETGCDVLGLDWTCDLGWARQLVGARAALQGNLDPSILLTDPSTIKQNVQRILASYGQGSGHIFNLGHGITPEVPVEHVKVLVDAVHEYSPAYHQGHL